MFVVSDFGDFPVDVVCFVACCNAVVFDLVAWCYFLFGVFLLRFRGCLMVLVCGLDFRFLGGFGVFAFGFGVSGLW